MLPPCSGQLTAIFVMVGAATLIKSAVGEHRHKTTGQLAAAGLLLVGVVAGSVITTQQLANDEEELEPVAADACTLNASTPQRLRNTDLSWGKRRRAEHLHHRMAGVGHRLSGATRKPHS